ncbi:MAG TPA: phosphoserine phosphatase SerB [Jiangellaceae bacterium]
MNLPAPSTVLAIVTGHDRPGVTARLFTAISEHAVDVVDVEQVVVRGRLILGILVTAPDDEPAFRAAVGKVAASLGLDVELVTGSGDAGQQPGRTHVTVLGKPLRPAAMAAVAGRIAARSGNIDRIVRLASYPVTSIELEVSGVDPAVLRVELAGEALSHGFDVAVQPSGLIRRAKRLVVMDVDSTLVQGEVIEMLAEKAGVLDQVAKVTAEAMRGELEFTDSLRARVRLLAGLPASAVDEVQSSVQLTPGARTLVRTLKRLGYRVAIVSGGFSQITEYLVDELGLDYAAANTLEIVDGQLTGELVGPVLDRSGKAQALRRFAQAAGVPLSQTVAVGDGANDLEMIATAGLGVAFNAKPVLREAADTAVNVPYLDAVLYLLGISRQEIEAADAADGYVTPAPPLD